MDEELVAGPHAVEAVLAAHPEALDTIWIARERRDGRLNALIDRAKAAGVRFRLVPRDRLDALARGLRHQGVVARRRMVAVRDEYDLRADLSAIEDLPLFLVLDGVQDPHNLGACLRSAAAAGAHGLVLPRDRSSPLSAAALRVAAGGAEAVPVYQAGNLARALQGLKDAGVWLVGLDAGGGQTLYELDLALPLAIVAGAEGRGLRRLTREGCDYLARIPLAEGPVSQLNLSVAAAVALFEARRQRGY